MTKSQSDNEPIEQLARAILSSAVKCADTVKPQIGFFTPEENNARWALILNEFLYFNLHMASVHALGQLGDAKRADLQNIIGPLVIGSLIENVYGHWPTTSKEGLRSEFYENLNKAEWEYATCNSLFPPEGSPFSEKSLLVKLARHISNLCANPTDKKLIWLIIETSFRELQQLNLEPLIAAIGNHLPGTANN